MLLLEHFFPFHIYNWRMFVVLEHISIMQLIFGLSCSIFFYLCFSGPFVVSVGRGGGVCKDGAEGMD